MGAEEVVRTRLMHSASRGVVITDENGNQIVNSEMTGGDESMDPDWWPEPKFVGFDEEEEEEN